MILPFGDLGAVTFDRCVHEGWEESPWLPGKGQ